LSSSTFIIFDETYLNSVYHLNNLDPAYRYKFEITSASFSEGSEESIIRLCTTQNLIPGEDISEYVVATNADGGNIPGLSMLPPNIVVNPYPGGMNIAGPSWTFLVACFTAPRTGTYSLTITREPYFE
jgi:hypothetical protein